MSTISLIMDLSLLTEDIMAGGGGGASKVKFGRAGRASRVGTKVGRLVKIVRLLRLTKLTKCLKNDAAEAEAEKKKEAVIRKYLKVLNDSKNKGNYGSVTGDNPKEEKTVHSIDLGDLKRVRQKERNDGISRWFDKGNTVYLGPVEEEEEEFMELPAESKIGTKIVLFFILTKYCSKLKK